MPVKLEIHQLKHNCQLIQAGNLATNASNMLLCKQQLAHISDTSNNVLIQSIASQIEHVARGMLSDDAIICIRRLNIDVATSFSALNSQYLSSTIAERLVKNLLKEYFDGNQYKIQTFDNEAHYSAHFLALCINASDKPAWCFQNYQLNQYLSADEAIVNCLFTESKVLPKVCRYLQELKAVDALPNYIQPLQAKWLFHKWHDRYVERSMTAHLVECTLDESTGFLSLPNFVDYARENDDYKGFIHLFLRKLADKPDLKINKTVFSSTIILFGILRFTQPLLKALKARSTAYLANALAHTASEIRAPILQVCELALQSSPLAQKVIERLQVIQGIEIPSSEQVTTHSAKAEVQQESSVESSTLVFNEFSDVAGISLLLPIIDSMRLCHWYSHNELHDAFHFMLAKQGVKSEQKWLSQLFDNDPQKRVDCSDDKSPLAQELMLGLHDSQKQTLQALTGTARLAMLMQCQFAVRLSGLQLSSSAYLFSQFFHTKGSIQLDEQAISIILHPIALNVVLKMSGYSPYSGQIEGINKHLSIEVRE